MRSIAAFVLLFSCIILRASAVILENGQLRKDPYPVQVEVVTIAGDNTWEAYSADATEISYKGRWDSTHISCMLNAALAPLGL